MPDKEEIQISTLPLLPLKNSVLFPGLLMPLSVGRAARSRRWKQALATEEKEIVVVAQRDVSVDTPGGVRPVHHRHARR